MASPGGVRRLGAQGVVGAVTGGHFLSHFYILAYPPLFPLLRAELGLTNTQLGLVMSVSTVGPLVLQLPAGRLVDRLGAKRMLVAGLGVTSLGTALVGTAETYLAVLAFAALAGAGQAVFHPADYSLLESAVGQATQGRTFSVHTFGGYAGFAAAPLVVGTLGLAFGWRAALVVVGGAGLAYAGLLFLARFDTADGNGDRVTADPDDGPLPSSLRSVVAPELVGLFGFFLLLSMASKGIQTFVPLLFVDEYGLSEAAGNTALAAFFVAASAGILLGGPLADRYRPSRVISPSLLGAAAVLAVVVAGVLPARRLVLVGGLAAVGLGTGLALPSRDRSVSLVSGAAGTGERYGFVFSGLSLGALVSPALLGAVIDAAGLRPAFALVAACYAAAVVVGVVAMRAGDARPRTEG